ncbi:MAG: nitroreductase family deazaflavin-dependent oxidoreductase [Thermoflexaceae bacterium]|nr:nitroreductase family deazaflavin-dependent oxidoreductase [Thermoflexaceae bacterium]
MNLPDLDPTLPYCYLTTTGRTSGEPREIEIWFALSENTLFLMAGGREKAHWVRNIQKTPAATVRLDGVTYAATARLVAAGSEEDALARRLLFEKYSPGYSGDLASWRETALPVALEIETRAAGL